MKPTGKPRYLPRASAVVLIAPKSEEELAAAERAETIEYFKTLGTIGGGSLAAFLALTSGAGLEDDVAGNLVLVGLCVYGAYLLFFDGGVTQAALENQAIMQLASEEADIMAGAPTAEITAYDAAATSEDAGAAVGTLEADGYARVNGVLSPDTAAKLLDYINSELTRKTEEEMEAQAESGGAGALSARQTFGDVLMKDNRYDLYLDLAAPVQAAMREALAPLAPVFAGSLGDDAQLFELAALVSDPRAPRQPVHPDTPWREGQGAAAVTAFIALQDVNDDMGPTDVIPGTHTKDAHEQFNSRDDGGREKVQLLRERPNHIGVLNVGDANLIDSRLMHCGGANDSTKRRILLYCSFKAPAARVPTGSLYYHLRRAGHSLQNRDEWLAAGSMDETASASAAAA